MTPLKVLLARIPTRLHARFKRACAERRLTMARQVEMLIEEFLRADK